MTKLAEIVKQVKERKENNLPKSVEGRLSNKRKTSDPVETTTDAYRIVADFETTIDEPVRVYRWFAYVKELDEYYDGYDIESFVEFIHNHKHSDIFFHNAKFDGSFILDYLIKHGAVHNGYMKANHYKYVMGDFNNFTYYWDYDSYVNVRDTMSLIKGSLAQFGNTIGITKGDTMQDAYYTNEQVDNLTTEQKDRLTKYCKLDVEILAKIMDAYHLYHLFEIAGTQAQLAYKGITQSELSASQYTIKPRNKLMPLLPKKISKEDEFVYVIPKNGKRLQHFLKSDWDSFDIYKKCNYDIKEIKTTVAKITNPDYEAMNFYKNSMTDYILPLEYYRFYYQGFGYKRFSDDKNRRQWEKEELQRVNAFAKLSYKGGLNYVNPKYQNQWLKKTVYQYDINSMYPWIYNSLPMPNALSKQRVNSLTKTDLGLVAINHLKAKCKTGKLPLIKLKTDTKYSIFDNSSNITSYDENFEYSKMFVLTNLEYQYLLDNYYIEDIEISSMFRFDRQTALETCFSMYCNYWYQTKNNAKTEVDRFFAKLMLNALYGKFGQFGKRYDRFTYELNGNTLERHYTGGYEFDKFTGADVLVASYITAYGRVYLANAINKIGLDNFVYCDTDSIHCFVAPDDIKSDFSLNIPKDDITFTKIIDNDGISIGSELGQFKYEGYSNLSKYIQTKTYGHLFNEFKKGQWKPEQWKTICAGFDDQVPIEDFEAGMQVNVTRSVIVNGGTKLETRQQELGAKWTGNNKRDLIVHYD